MKEKFSSLKTKFKEYISWQDYLFFGVILVYSVLLIKLLLELKQLPSPIYGGDYYFSMGTVHHFISGGNPFVSSSFIGGLPAYLPLYTILVGIFIKITGLEVFAGMKVFSFFLMLASLIFFYFFMNYYFKNKLVGILGVLLFLPLTSFPFFKYLQFTLTIMFPAFIFSLYYLFKKRTVSSAIFLGIIFGLLGISHTIGFVSGVFVFFLFSIYALFLEGFDMKTKFKIDKTKFKTTFKLLFVVGIIAFVIAQIYWLKPLFVYHGKTQTGLVEYSQNDFSKPGSQIKYLLQTIKTIFFDFKDFYSSFKTILFDLGFVALFFLIKNRCEEVRFAKFLFIASIITIFHFLIVYPIMKTHFVPDYMSSFLVPIFQTIFILFALIAILNSKNINKYKNYFVICLILILILVNLNIWNKYDAEDRWINVGKVELSPPLTKMQSWILKNTEVNDVFLSNNELSFSINALTGRKVVNFRRGHSDAFTDLDQRLLDSAIILYGNDDAVRTDLIKKYNVKYFYWFSYWLQSEYTIQDGKIAGTYDPILLRDSPDTRKTLEKYNISFYPEHTWLDPSLRSDFIKQFDVLFILPKEFNTSHPWIYSLDKYLEPVWEDKQQNSVIQMIYKIHI